jgi:hypothetical protein
VRVDQIIFRNALSALLGSIRQVQAPLCLILFISAADKADRLEACTALLPEVAEPVARQVAVAAAVEPVAQQGAVAAAVEPVAQQEAVAAAAVEPVAQQVAVAGVAVGQQQVVVVAAPEVRQQEPSVD